MLARPKNDSLFFNVYCLQKSSKSKLSCGKNAEGLDLFHSLRALYNLIRFQT